MESKRKRFSIDWKSGSRVIWRHFRFWLSRQIDYPLVEPDILQLCFLFRCNLSCNMCNIRERQEAVKNDGLSCELPLETMKDLILQASRMKIRKLFLLGGEPFLSKDLFEVLRFSHQYGMSSLVSTNGTLLGNPGTIEELLDSGLETLAVSIDGASEKTYAKIRGAGIFEKIKSNILLLERIKKEKQKTRPSVFVSCTVMNHNIEELTDIVRLAREIGSIGISFQPVVFDNTDQQVRNDLDYNWIPASRYALLDRAVDELIRLKLSSEDNFGFIYNDTRQLLAFKNYFRGLMKKRIQGCYVGFNRIVVSQDGRLYFCAKDPVSGKVSFGDVYKDKLNELWYSSSARRFRRMVRGCAHPCLLNCSRRDEFDRLSDVLNHNFLGVSGTN